VENSPGGNGGASSGITLLSDNSINFGTMFFTGGAGAVGGDGEIAYPGGDGGDVATVILRRVTGVTLEIRGGDAGNPGSGEPPSTGGEGGSLGIIILTHCDFSGSVSFIGGGGGSGATNGAIGAASNHYLAFTRYFNLTASGLNSPHLDSKIINCLCLGTTVGDATVIEGTAARPEPA
jgi:hypothetical protein